MDALANISQARQLLDSADLELVLEVRDKAGALQSYYKARQEGYSAQCRAAEIKLMAERRAGEILAEMEKTKPGPKKQGGKIQSQPATELIGITKSDSSRWQQEAKDAKQGSRHGGYQGRLLSLGALVPSAKCSLLSRPTSLRDVPPRRLASRVPPLRLPLVQREP